MQRAFDARCMEGFAIGQARLWVKHTLLFKPCKNLLSHRFGPFIDEISAIMARDDRIESVGRSVVLRQR